MALANFDAFVALCETVNMDYAFGTTANLSGATDTTLGTSMFVPLGGTAPTTAVALGAANTPGLSYSSGRLSNRAIGNVSYFGRPSSTTQWYASGLLIYDRLSHQGGLNGNINTVQTTNLPTAALSRYTSGVGVFAAMEVHTGLGATDSSVSVSYTNEAGTSGRVGSIVLGGSTPGVRTFYPMNMQAGDTGVRSIESVTLSIATGSVGAFGMVLYKPLAIIPPIAFGETLPANLITGWNTGIDTDACICGVLASGPTSFDGSLVLSTGAM